MKLKKLFAASVIIVGIAAFGFTPSIASGAEKIEFWTMSMKPKFIPYYTSLVKTYEAQNPGIKIEWVDYPFDVTRTKLTVAIAAGSPPALVNLNLPWAEEYARDGLIIPVDSLLGNKAVYAKGALEDLTFKGKIYGFPYYNNLNVIAYNSTLFKAAGLTAPPKSLDEELKFAIQIAAKTGKAGYAPTLGKIDNIFMQQGLDITKNGKAVFNSPKHVELIKKLAETYKAKGLLRDNLFAEDSFPTVIDAYKGGRLGMMVTAPTALLRIKQDAKDVYAVTEVAAAPLGPTGIADGGWLFHFAIPKGQDPSRLPAISKFGLFLTNDENQLAIAKIAGVFPSTVKASNDPFFQNLPPNAGALEKAIAIGARNMKNTRSLYAPGLPDYDELRRVLVKAVEGGVTGKKDIKTALDEAVAIWNKKLVK